MGISDRRAEYAADRDASVCGEMDMMGVRDSVRGVALYEDIKSSTSV